MLPLIIEVHNGDYVACLMIDSVILSLNFCNFAILEQFGTLVVS